MATGPVTPAELGYLSAWESKRLVRVMSERFTPEEFRALVDQVQEEFKRLNPRAVTQQGIPTYRGPKR